MRKHGIMTSTFISRNCRAVCILLLLVVSFGIVPGAASAAGVFAASNMFSKAVSLMDSGKTREAVQIYDALIQKSRFSRDIHKALYLKGVCLQAMKQDQQAIP